MSGATSSGVLTGSGLFLILNSFDGSPGDYSDKWWLLLLGTAFMGVVVTSFAQRMDLAREANK